MDICWQGMFVDCLGFSRLHHHSISTDDLAKVEKLIASSSHLCRKKWILLCCRNIQYIL